MNKLLVALCALFLLTGCASKTVSYTVLDKPVKQIKIEPVKNPTLRYILKHIDFVYMLLYLVSCSFSVWYIKRTGLSSAPFEQLKKTMNNYMSFKYKAIALVIRALVKKGKKK